MNGKSLPTSRILIYKAILEGCTVVALWVVTGKPLRDCFEYMRIHGRKPRKGMSKLEWNKALESMNKFRVKKGPYDQRNRITVGQFIRKHPVGTYYVANNGHAFVIKDGEIHDHTEGLRRQITCAYRVYSKDELGEDNSPKFCYKVVEEKPVKLTEFDKGVFFAASLLYSYWGNFDQAITVITESGLTRADISGLSDVDKQNMILMMEENPERIKFTYNR